MKAAILGTTARLSKTSLKICERAMPVPADDEVLIRVLACGVCRTDLHIVEGDLPAHHSEIVPGHQIVGDIVAKGTACALAIGTRVGVGWLGGTDGTCRYCRSERENLCDHPVFTGYDRDGGYAEFVSAKADFIVPLPGELDASTAAPLLCAGIIGFRALRVAGVQSGEHVGLYGFGSSAALVLPILRAWKCSISIVTRGAAHRAFARELGADWVGAESAVPPTPLDRAITFAPSGAVVIAALAALGKGGVVAINAVHLDKIPEFDYDGLLWGERQIRSVTNMTRNDASDYLALAAQLHIRPKVSSYSLDQVNEALLNVKNESTDGSTVIMISSK